MTLAQLDVLLTVHNAAIRRQRSSATQDAGSRVSVSQWASMVAERE